MDAAGVIEALATQPAQTQRGAIGWWRLGETTGTIAADDTYQGDGTYLGGLVRNGAAGVVFDGTSGRIETPTTKDVNQGEFTLVARIKAGAAGAVRTLIGKGPAGIVLRLDATNKPQIAIGGGAVLLTAPAALDAAEHTIAAMYGPRPGGTLALNVDGARVASLAMGDVTTTATLNPWTIGAYIDGAGARSAYFNGTMLDAAIWNRSWLTTPAVAWAIPDWFYRVPSILTTWRDPAAPTAPIAVELPLNAIAAGSPVGPNSVSVDAPSTGAAAYVAFTDSRGVYVGNAAGVLPTLSTTLRVYNLGQSQYVDMGPFPTPVTFALPRLTPNVSLGNAASALTVALAMIAPDLGVAFVRAAIGPNAGDYAPGSSWVLASQAGTIALPATGAYLAVQLQLVRASPRIGSLLAELAEREGVAPLPSEGSVAP